MSKLQLPLNVALYIYLVKNSFIVNFSKYEKKFLWESVLIVRFR